MRLGSQRFHLVGVGGAGMSALARLLHGIGAQVSGSDAVTNEAVERLQHEGVGTVWVGRCPERLRGEDGYVVRSAAVPPSDPEVAEAERRGFTSLLYAEAVGRLSEGKRTFSLAGTHGKTTTTALTVAALRGGGLDPSHLVGGEVPELGGNGYGGQGPEFVVEACEFNRSFHSLRPFAAAILNLDHDHFDCYPSRGDLEESFGRYLSHVRQDGVVLIDEDVPASVVEGLDETIRVWRLGAGLFADIRAVDVEDDRGRYSFVPLVLGERWPRVQLSLSGRFQVHNALFAIGMAKVAGADPEGTCAGIRGFAGVRRRFELRTGEQGGMLVNDYAHHPAEIRAVIRAARRRFPEKRLLVAFQPHQYRRTLHLLPQFAEVLSEVDRCLVADIYGARETDEVRRSVSAEDLASAVRDLGGSCEHFGAVEQLPGRLRQMRADEDLVLLLGAGDIDQVVEEIVDSL